MALPDKVNEVFKDDPETLNSLKTMDDTVTSLTSKVAEMENTLKAFGNITPKDIEALKATNADLINQRKNWKENKDNVVDKADHNAVLEKLNLVETKLNDWEKKYTEAEEKLKNKELEVLNTNIKTAVVSAAAKAVDPTKVHTLMVAEGLVGLKDGKDGAKEPFFHILNDKNEHLTANSAEEAVAKYLEKNNYLLAPQGAPGLGRKHTGGGTTTNPGSAVPNRQEAAAAFRASFKGE